MAKLARTQSRTSGPRRVGTSPMATTGPTLTHESGVAYSRDAKSDLFLLAVTNMVGEDTFYESADERDQRFRGLVWQVALEDPAWLARFVPFLRSEMFMRSAAVVMAAEYALALRGRKSGRPDAPSVRSVIASALQRADEPGEFVAYWMTRTGKRTLPGGVQRGLSDAMARLFTQRAAIKYDGTGQPWRLGDVVELVHPDPAAVLRNRQFEVEPELRERMVAEKAALYAYLLDRRHHADELRAPMEAIQIVAAARAFLSLPPAEQRERVLADPTVLDRTGLTWEVLSSSGAMDARAWEAIIPRMGYMALLRNLRNFDQAGVSDTVADQVNAKLTDPDEVAHSKQFPYRFLSAYKATESDRWARALGKALDLACRNIPALPGRTLVLIDTSSSMTTPLSAKSKVQQVEVAALFGFALAARGADVDVFGFAGGGFWGRGPRSKSAVTFEHSATKGGSVLRDVSKFIARVGEVGHGTETVQAIRETLRPEHDRVVIFTDGQTFGDRYGTDSVETLIPAKVPAFAVNTAGYAPAMLDLAKDGRFEIGGFSDRMFTMIDLLTRGRTADWPF